MGMKEKLHYFESRYFDKIGSIMENGKPANERQIMLCECHKLLVSELNILACLGKIAPIEYKKLANYYTTEFRYALEVLKRVKRKENKMRVTYKIKMEINANYEIDDFTELKSGHEYARDICEFVADEIAVAGGTVIFEVLETELHAK